MKNVKIEIKWALIFVVMTLLWMVLEKLAGLHDTCIDKHAIYTNFIAIPAILIYVLALFDKKKNCYSGTMTYMQGFFSGLIITAIVTVISPLTQYITSTYITTTYFANVIKYSVESGNLTQQAAEEYFNLKSFVIQGLIGTPIMGVITTAVVAFFTKSRKSES